MRDSTCSFWIIEEQLTEDDTNIWSNGRTNSGNTRPSWNAQKSINDCIYSVDDMSKYDSTAVIDKVLELTGKEGTYWIGLSQGTTMAYLTLADHPEYNSKVNLDCPFSPIYFASQIKALFQTGPAGTAGYAQGPIKIALWAYKALKPGVDVG